MLSAVSSLSAAYHGRSALQLLQVSVDRTGTDGSIERISAGLSPLMNGTANAAIDILIRIALDAKGNSDISIEAKDGAVTATAGSGDDAIKISAGAAIGVYGGSGNDTINIAATGMKSILGSFNVAADNVEGGEGDDIIHIDGHGVVMRIDGDAGNDLIEIGSTGGNGSSGMLDYGIDIVKGGAGNDTIKLASDSQVGRINGDTGDDIIDIKANGRADRIHGGDGSDSITAQAKDVSVLDGGAGDDMIVVNASHASYIDGGDGNDTIIVTTDGFLAQVSGGKGNDHVVLDNKGRAEASYYFSAGDGRDVIVTKSPLEISGFSEDGTRRLDMSKADITMDGDTVTIGFAGSSDSITVKLGGRMADAGNVHLVYRPETQSLLIADDRYIAENTPAPPVFDRSEDNHVGSFHR
jgi:Ca2+-binding RTX toxin-like protein